MMRSLEWDSDFFGIKTARIDALKLSGEELAEQLENFHNSSFGLLYIFAPHNLSCHNKEILSAGGILMDEKVTFTMNVDSINPSLSPHIRSCKGSEMDKDLETLAIESGKYSRFKVDKRIPRNKFEELYRLWMKNSLNGTFAKEVYAYEDEGQKLGMITIDIRENEGWIGIIAVNEAYRGRSIGKLLMHAAIRFCKENKVSILNVQTQLENKISCAFYEKIGFAVRGVEDVYHVWGVGT